MGGGNGQKSKMAREKNLEKQKAVKGSQLESNKKAMSIQLLPSMGLTDQNSETCSLIGTIRHFKEFNVLFVKSLLQSLRNSGLSYQFATSRISFVCIPIFLSAFALAFIPLVYETFFWINKTAVNSHLWNWKIMFESFNFHVLGFHISGF